jgi:hypothetical protein
VGLKLGAVVGKLDGCSKRVGTLVGLSVGEVVCSTESLHTWHDFLHSPSVSLSQNQAPKKSIRLSQRASPITLKHSDSSDGLRVGCKVESMGILVGDNDLTEGDGVGNRVSTSSHLPQLLSHSCSRSFRQYHPSLKELMRVSQRHCPIASIALAHAN